MVAVSERVGGVTSCTGAVQKAFGSHDWDLRYVNDQ